MVGIYLLYHDLSSLVNQQRSLLERTVYLTARLTPSEPLQAALQTKDSATDEDKRLQDHLFTLQTDLNLAGNLSVVTQEEAAYRMLATTKPMQKKGDAYLPPTKMIASAHTDMPSSSSWYRKGLSFWSSSYSPIKDASGKTLAYMALESEETPFFYRLVGYVLHYVLLAIGLITIGGFLYVWVTAKANRNVSFQKNRYFTLFRETKDGVLFLNEAGEIQKANESALHYFQEKEGDLIGANLLSPHESSFSFFPLDSSKQILSETVNRGECFHSKAKLILRSDVVRYLSFSSSPLLDDGKIVGAIIIFQDITNDVIREQELKHHRLQLQEQNQQLQQQVITDSLTKCLNKQYLHHFLEEKNLRWSSLEGCSMLVIDLDNFKSINDTHGHVIGDTLLQNFGIFLKSFFRRSDKIIRYGGDEFVILLPQTHLKAASRIALNLQESLKKTPFPMSDILTVSVGVAQLQKDEPGKTWLSRADSALLTAKRSGKNRVHLQDEEELQLEILN